MIKKIIGMLLCLSLFLGMNAFAQTQNIKLNPIIFNNNLITITGNHLLGEGKFITLTVKKNDANLIDNEQIFAVLQEASDKQGNFKFMFSIPDEKCGISGDGEYEVTLKGQETEKVFDLFNFASKQIREQLISQIKMASEITLKAILSDNNNLDALIVMGADMKTYNGLSEQLKDKTVYTMFKYGDLKNINEFVFCSVFRHSMGLSMINEDEISKGLSVYNASYKDIQFCDITDGNLIAFLEKRLAGKYENFNIFEKQYALENALYFICHARVEQFIETLKSNIKAVDLENSSNYKQICSLSDAKQSKVSDYMVPKLNNISTSDELNSLMGSALASLENTGGSSSGSSSSGSSSPNSLGFEVPFVPTENQNDKKEMFTDLEDVVWAKEAINKLAEKGIVSGYETHLFSPNKQVTREEFVKMMILAGEIQSDTQKCEFIDVNENDWHYKYIASAANLHLINGISNEYFGINLPITRQDMAVMAQRTADYCDILLKEVRTYTQFDDHEKISDYALQGIKSLYMAGILNGNGNNKFDPNMNCTRAEAAKLIYELFCKTVK